MTTQIFNSLEEFTERKDKKINGCKQEFLDSKNLTLEQFAKMNETNTGCWECIECFKCETCLDVLCQ